jgi:hypothetical protein
MIRFQRRDSLSIITTKSFFAPVRISAAVDGRTQWVGEETSQRQNAEKVISFLSKQTSQS